jgi:hypothetical protein
MTSRKRSSKHDPDKTDAKRRIVECHQARQLNKCKLNPRDRRLLREAIGCSDKGQLRDYLIKIFASVKLPALAKGLLEDLLGSRLAQDYFSKYVSSYTILKNQVVFSSMLDDPDAPTFIKTAVALVDSKRAEELEVMRGLWCMFSPLHAKRALLVTKKKDTVYGISFHGAAINNETFSIGALIGDDSVFLWYKGSIGMAQDTNIVLSTGTMTDRGSTYMSIGNIDDLNALPCVEKALFETEPELETNIIRLISEYYI